MIIKAVVITENGKPIRCFEITEFNTVEKFNEMVKTCEKNYQELKRADLSKEAQNKKNLYDMNQKMSEIERKVENNTKLIMGENEDEEENN